MRGLALFAVAMPLLGCVAMNPTKPAALPPAPCTAFQHVQRFRCGPLAHDCGPGSLAELKATVRTGDMLVVYLDPHRAVLLGYPQYLLLPCGHALVALDGPNGRDFLECMTGGAKRIRPEILRRYSQVDVYRLADPAMLDLARLHQFAEVALAKTRAYDFRTWVGWNASMRPTRPEEIAPGYSCAGVVAAAFHFAGANLSAAAPGWRMVTPQQLVKSVVAPVASVRLRRGNRHRVCQWTAGRRSAMPRSGDRCDS